MTPRDWREEVQRGDTIHWLAVPGRANSAGTVEYTTDQGVHVLVGGRTYLVPWRRVTARYPAEPGGERWQDEPDPWDRIHPRAGGVPDGYNDSPPATARRA